MASGTITGSGSWIKLKITWSSTAGTGGSKVNASLIAQNVDYSYWYATVGNGYYLTINGDKKTGDTAKLSTVTNGSSTLLTHSVWVAYTGEKSITLSGYANMNNITNTTTGNAVGTRSVSGTAVLDKIGSVPTMGKVTAPVASTISETTPTIIVKWEKATSYDDKCIYSVGVSINGGAYTWYYPDSNINTTSYTYTLTTKTQGTTYQFAVAAENDVGWSTYEYSGVVTLNSLSPPTIGSLSTYNPYVTSTLSVPLSGGSQSNGNSFKRVAALYHGSTELATYTPSGNENTTASITVPVENYLKALGATKYSDTFTIVAWIQNSNGSKSETVSKNFTVNINSDGGATPKLNAPVISGGLTGYSSTCFIVGKHDLKVTSGTATARRATTDTTLTYSISCTGYSAVNSNSATFSAPTTGNKTITVTVTDSRGLSTSQTVYRRFQTWSKPTVTISSAERDETTPSTIKVTYKMQYTPIYDTYGSDGNTAGTDINGIATQQYTTLTSYTNCTSPLSITGTNTETGYTVTVRVLDKIDSTAYGTASRFVGTVDKYIAYRSDSIGFGCIPASAYRLDIKGAIRVYDVNGNVKINSGNIYTSGNVCIPNSKYIYSYRADGTSHPLLTMGSADNVVLNYVGYRDKIGMTNIYGNTLNLSSNNTIVTNKSIEVNGQVFGKGYGHIIGANRINQTWIGYYPTYTDAVNSTSRYGFIGYSSANNNVLQIVNERTSAITLKTYVDGEANAGVTINHNALYPDTDDTRTCGHSSYRWKTVYATNGTINTSDRTHKKNIQELNDKYVQLFYRLMPVSFQFNYVHSDRTHIGFISQDVEEVMKELGISDLEFAGFCKDVKQIYNEETDTWEDVKDSNGNPVYIYSLRYQEFIALNTYMIQKQQLEINELKQLVKGGE